MACNACTDDGDLEVKICVTHEIFPEHGYVSQQRFSGARAILGTYGTFPLSLHRSQISCPADLLHLRQPNAKFRKSVSVHAKNAYIGRRSKAPLILKNDTRVRKVEFGEVKQRLL